MLTIKEAYEKHSSPSFPVVQIVNGDGEVHFIDGYRPADDDSGCMAQGSPEAHFGRDKAGNVWIHSPTGWDGKDGKDWDVMSAWSRTAFKEFGLPKTPAVARALTPIALTVDRVFDRAGLDQLGVFLTDWCGPVKLIIGVPEKNWLPVAARLFDGAKLKDIEKITSFQVMWVGGIADIERKAS